MKNTYFAIIFSFTFVNSAPAAELTVQECVGLRTYMSTVLSLIDAVAEYERASTLNTALLSVKSINDPDTLGIMAQQSEVGKKLSPLMAEITSAIKGLMPLINAYR